MTIPQLKKSILAWPGVEFHPTKKPKSYTVDFIDLARCKKTFLEVFFKTWPGKEKWDEMYSFCKEEGVILTNNQLWIGGNE